jgi:hypothetical protein
MQKIKLNYQESLKKSGQWIIEERRASKLNFEMCILMKRETKLHIAIIFENAHLLSNYQRLEIHWISNFRIFS